MRDAHRPALRAQNHQVRYGDRALSLGDAAFDLLAGIRAGMPLDHRDMLDQRLIFEWIDTQYAPALALIPARDHPDLIVLLQLNTYRLRRFAPRHCHQITSGARETIFINFLSRSSR